MFSFMWRAVRLFGWALWVLGSFLSFAKFLADWVGRSTLPEDAASLWGKMMPIIEFLQRQPDLWFYFFQLALVAIGIALITSRRISHYFQNESSSRSTAADNQYTPLIEVASEALSRVRDTDVHIVLNYAAHGTVNELRRMADIITKWHDVYGRIPHTKALHKIRAGSYFTALTDEGALVAVEVPNTGQIAFVDLAIPTSDVEAVISSTIRRTAKAFDLDV